ncbi:MAG TPA: type 4a pilus biogenesis protein PilO [Candidatus Acidoferrales bacterium]|nr:type 4a pilus biogenesis protein PilO [Candidatus Acidoferrales bacterium]
MKICLACVLALDALLVYEDWRASNTAPQAQAQERDRLALRARQLHADVALGRAVEKQLPTIQKQCDSFYQQRLLPDSTGYSVVVADLSRIVKDAGVQSNGVNFRPSQVKDRGLSEVVITATVQGDYRGLIRLINALERSPHFYVLDGLTLASESSGTIQLNLSLRTYFRT